MLRAYNYVDVNFNNSGLLNFSSWEKEKNIYERLSRHYSSVSCKNKNDLCTCPICDNESRFVFNKLGFRYFQCNYCKSIFLPVEEEIVNEYADNEEIHSLYQSEEYQKEAVIGRNNQWNELLEWLEFRSYRYLGQNTGLDIISYRNNFLGLSDLIRKSGLCNIYCSKDSLVENDNDFIKEADLVLYLACIQKSLNPVKDLSEIKSSLKQNGILFLSSRLGTGFDILVLQSNANRIFPLEHTLLPSIKGLRIVLQKCGYKELEIITPGNQDVSYVLQNKDKVPDSNYFIKYLLDEANNTTLNEFQRFLQKNNLSSYVQIIAKKE